MCKKTKYHKTSNTRIDRCMRGIVEFINNCTKFKTVACCCGHKKYPMSLVIRTDETKRLYEIFSGMHIERKRRIYRKDKNGFYYIPEAVKAMEILNS